MGHRCDVVLLGREPVCQAPVALLALPIVLTPLAVGKSCVFGSVAGVAIAIIIPLNKPQNNSCCPKRDVDRVPSLEI